jgi:hypothetical protein
MFYSAAYKSCALTVLRLFASVLFIAQSSIQYTLSLKAVIMSDELIIFLLFTYAFTLLATTSGSLPAFFAALDFAIKIPFLKN